MSNAKRNMHFIKNKSDKISIILLSAGEPDRMKSFGVRSLIRLYNGETLIDNQLNIINEVFDHNEIILVAGFEADTLMNKTPESLIKVENERYKETNVARSISLGLRASTTDKIVIVYGDVIFNKSCLQFQTDKSCVIIDHHVSDNENEIGCNIDANRVELMLYGLANKWAQIMFLTGNELRIMKQLVWNRNNEKKFGFELINEVINSGGTMAAYINKDNRHCDIDCGKDIEKARLII